SGGIWGTGRINGVNRDFGDSRCGGRSGNGSRAGVQTEARRERPRCEAPGYRSSPPHGLQCGVISDALSTVGERGRSDDELLCENKGRGRRGCELARAVAKKNGNRIVVLIDDREILFPVTIKISRRDASGVGARWNRHGLLKRAVTVAEEHIHLI